MSEESPVLYICGKVSGLPDHNKPKFAEATRQLKALGFIVRNPLEICASLPEGTDADQWVPAMKLCIKTLMDCDHLILLDDWKTSPGAQLEVELAHRMNIAVYELQPYLNQAKILSAIAGA